MLINETCVSLMCRGHLGMEGADATPDRDHWRETESSAEGEAERVEAKPLAQRYEMGGKAAKLERVSR